MAKNTFFFSHDGGARNDEKILAVRMKHKAEGYAVYFMLLEKLLESNNYSLIKDYNVLAFDLRVSAEIVKSIVEDFGLFDFTDDQKYFFSNSFIERMNPLEIIKHRNSIKGIKGNLIRYGHLTKEQVNNMSESEIIEFHESRTANKNSRTANAQGTPNESHNEQKNSHKIRQDKTREDKIREDKNINIIENENSKIEISANSSLQTSQEKEKSSAKKEKDVLPFKKMLTDEGANEEAVDEWFNHRLGERKKTTRYFVEQFILECRKNNFTVKEAVEACAVNQWINFNAQWLVNQRKSKTNAKSIQDNTNDPKIGRANLSDYEKLHQQMVGR